jgi:ADP-ribose pyrophosphatase
MSSSSHPLIPAPVDMEEVKVSSTCVHKGRVVTFYDDEARLPDGRIRHRDKLVHPGGVVICPILPDGKVILVQQWRYALGHALLEFPAGKLDTTDTSPLAAAKRELIEETGYSSDEWRTLPGIYTAPGFCDERLWLFKASNLRQPHLGECDTHDDEENIQLITLTAEQVWELANEGHILDAKTLSLLALVLR